MGSDQRSTVSLRSELFQVIVFGSLGYDPVVKEMEDRRQAKLEAEARKRASEEKKKRRKDKISSEMGKGKGKRERVKSEKSKVSKKQERLSQKEVETKKKKDTLEEVKRGTTTKVSKAALSTFKRSEIYEMSNTGRIDTSDIKIDMSAVSKKVKVVEQDDEAERERLHKAASGVQLYSIAKSLWDGSKKDIEEDSRLTVGSLIDSIKVEEDEESPKLRILNNIDKYDMKAYKTPDEFLRGNGIITQKDWDNLIVIQGTLKRDKNVNLSPIDLAVITKVISEENAIRALTAVYNVDFLSSERLNRMPVLTDTYSRAVCKKYCFIHVDENPRVLVATYGSSLHLNLGQHFGNARVIYAMRSSILSRIDSVEEWEHDSSSVPLA